ncbi:unnamed protein product [marine sediment metagenome]|uniref:Uncharacterized protein n=1 Tax=marine sediment metagenome TaxID=412755 RepID=X0T5A2_9ZZZZ
MPAITKKTFYFTMVHHPTKGLTRVGKAYSSRAVAQSWVPFLRHALHGLRVTVSQCTFTWRDGVLDERSRRVLDEKFNMDPPKEK